MIYHIVFGNLKSKVLPKQSSLIYKRESERETRSVYKHTLEVVTERITKIHG